MELVTVIIPYFRKKEFIKDSLSSVINQTYKKLEIILIYDDCNLNDLKYIKKLIKIDSRISLIINKNSLGAGRARNKGIKKSKGSYVCFLDADDIWDKNKIDLQIKFMRDSNYLVTHTSYNIIDKNKKKIGKRKARNFNHINDLLKSCDIGLSSVMIKKKILIGENMFPDLKTKEDFVLWLKFLKLNIKIGSLKRNLMSWRKLNNSLSSSTIQKLIDGFRVYNQYMHFNWLKSLYFLFCLSINFLKKD